MKETGFDNFQTDIEELLMEIDRTTATPSKKRKNENNDDIISGKKEFKEK
jgi:hypothetical protein